MKRNKSIITIIVLIFFTSSISLFSQDNKNQNKEQVKAKEQIKTELKNQIKEQNQTQEQLKPQLKNQIQSKNKFGYHFANVNKPDADGDGIPNGRDEDYTGAKFKKGNNGTKGFVDLNGDGINDNAIDSDGDGIPNGQDPDYVKPEDGTGQKNMKGKLNQNTVSGKKYGPGDGTGTGVGPKDGTGYGAPTGAGTGSGTGTCDGTGPKGKRGIR